MKKIIFPFLFIFLAFGALYAFFQKEGFLFDPRPETARAIGGSFSLTDHTGKTVTEQTLIGKPSLVFFGYTNCPHICPTVLTDLSSVLKNLPQGAVTSLFISVDPERDTQAVLADYLKAFDPQIRGLTGSNEAIQSVLSHYRVHTQKTAPLSGKVGPSDHASYDFDHSSIVYLMDKKGEFATILNLDQPMEAIIKTITPYL